jgi:hypothetical protein
VITVSPSTTMTLLWAMAWAASIWTGDAGVGHEVGGGVLLRPLAPFQDDLNLDAAFVGIDKGLGGWRGREAVGLD